MKGLTAIVLLGWFFIAIEGAKIGGPIITQARVALQAGPFVNEEDCNVIRVLLLTVGGFDKTVPFDGCWNSDEPFPPGPGDPTEIK